jgi:hypothetical protein
MAVPRPCNIPCASELRNAPELACLALLDSALVAAELALVAAEPELDHDPRRRSVHDPRLSARYHLACTVLALTDALRTSLGCYRQVVSDEYSDKAGTDRDIPF